MPTYEYKCTHCGHTFEAVQSMNDKPLSRCPKCKSAIRRVINGGMGIIFKGSGFYTTDNKKSSTLTGGNGGSRESRESKDKKPATADSSSSSSSSSSSGGSSSGSSSSSADAKGTKEKTTAS